MDPILSKAARIRRGARFSPCRTWRYRLWRIWEPSRGLVAWIGLNPSTADETNNDPTVERCERRTRAMGYGGMTMLNLFGFRATDPAVMKAATEPVGRGNDAAILSACRQAQLIVCCWGNHGAHLDRSRRVLSLLRKHHLSLHCLGQNRTGEPLHPLYVPYTSQPRPLE
jgi:hypothetical protein